MNRVIHFEIHAQDLVRASNFYTTVFGWQFAAWPGNADYMTIKTGEGVGIDGGMIKRKGEIDGEAVIAYVCTIQVMDVGKTLENVTANGGAIAVGRQEVMGVGYLAYCKD